MIRRRLSVVFVAASLFLATVSGAHGQEIYVPNYVDMDVSVLNATTLATLARVPLEGGNPSGVALSDDGRFAFVVLSPGGRVAVVDLQSRTVVKYIEIFSTTFDALITARPQGDRMYVTSCQDPFIEVIDVATQESIDRITLPTGTYSIDFAPDGRTAYAATGYEFCSDAPVQGLYVLNLDDNTVADFVDVSQFAGDVAVAPSGRFALVTGGDRIVFVDLLALEEEGAVMCGALPCAYGMTLGIVFNDAGTRAYAVDTLTNEIITIDTRQGTLNFLQELSRVPIVTSGFAWQIALSGQCAHVAAYGFPTSEIINFNIQTDIPIQVRSGSTGEFAYELAVAGDARCPLPRVGGGNGGVPNQCKQGGWRTFGIFRNQGDCMSFFSTEGKNAPAGRRP